MIQRLSALLCDATSLAENDLDMMGASVDWMKVKESMGYGERSWVGEEIGKHGSTNPCGHVHGHLWHVKGFKPSMCNCGMISAAWSAQLRRSTEGHLTTAAIANTVSAIG